jgi:endonuclease/exonuclease/phosphatase family metal-dependent hydrolase
VGEGESGGVTEADITEVDVTEPALEPIAVPRRRWRRWRVRLAALVCTSWLLFVVLHRILSDRVYWWGPFDLLPPLVFALVPVLLLVLAVLTRPVRWWLSGVTVLALILGIGYSGINFATLWYRPPPAGNDAITLVTWNTEYWDQDMRDGGVLTAASTEALYRFLRGLNADVYMLQEYAHIDQTITDSYAQALAIDQEAKLHETFPGYTVVIEGRNVILSRFPVVGHTWLDSTPFLPDDLRPVPPGLADRPLFYKSQTLRADIEVNGHVVSFYDCHFFQPPTRILFLQNDVNRSMFQIDRSNFEMRNAAVQAVAKDIKQNTNRVVLGGDLNTSPTMKNILGRLPGRLVDQTRALSSIYPITWPADRANELWRLDWLFTSSDVTVHDYTLVDPKGLSDHEAQRVVLSAD